MQFKEGNTWKACYDEIQNLYTAFIETVVVGYSYTLYEIDQEIFDGLIDGDESYDGQHLISQGRCLYMEVNDTCGPGYTVVFDDDYQKLCPWTKVAPTQEVLPKEMTDAVIAVLPSEEKNRQHRKEKEAKEKKSDESCE